MEKMSIHATIRSHRLRLGMTEQQFADRAGVTRAAVQQWEREGGTAPRRSKQADVANVLGISLAELLGVADTTAQSVASEGAMQVITSSAPVATAPSQPPALSQALEVVVAALAKVPMDSRKAVADDMGLLAMAPDSSETLARLAASLAPAHQETRLPGTESHEFQPPTPPSMFLKNTEKT